MRSLQKNTNLRVTGIYDKTTRCFMSKTRCSQSDTKNVSTIDYLKKQNLTYLIESWSDLVPERNQRNTVVNAFYSLRKDLSRMINLDWNKSHPDVRIRFVKGRLNDLISFSCYIINSFELYAMQSSLTSVMLTLCIFSTGFFLLLR